LDPRRKDNYERAKSRRDWVIARMEEERFITEVDALLAMSQPIKLATGDETEFVSADFFSETVRQPVIDTYDETTLYEAGLAVHTTLDPLLQGHAVRALRKGLLEYDRRHGWRGALTSIPVTEGWAEALKAVPLPPAKGRWEGAVVLSLKEDGAIIGLMDGGKG